MKYQIDYYLLPNGSIISPPELVLSEFVESSKEESVEKYIKKQELRVKKKGFLRPFSPFGYQLDIVFHEYQPPEFKKIK